MNTSKSIDTPTTDLISSQTSNTSNTTSSITSSFSQDSSTIHSGGSVSTQKRRLTNLSFLSLSPSSAAQLTPSSSNKHNPTNTTNTTTNTTNTVLGTTTMSTKNKSIMMNTTSTNASNASNATNASNASSTPTSLQSDNISQITTPPTHSKSNNGNNSSNHRLTLSPLSFTSPQQQQQQHGKLSFLARYDNNDDDDEMVVEENVPLDVQEDTHENDLKEEHDDDDDDDDMDVITTVDNNNNGTHVITTLDNNNNDDDDMYTDCSMTPTTPTNDIPMNFCPTVNPSPSFTSVPTTTTTTVTTTATNATTVNTTSDTPLNTSSNNNKGNIPTPEQPQPQHQQSSPSFHHKIKSRLTPKDYEGIYLLKQIFPTNSQDELEQMHYDRVYKGTSISGGSEGSEGGGRETTPMSKGGDNENDGSKIRRAVVEKVSVCDKENIPYVTNAEKDMTVSSPSCIRDKSDKENQDIKISSSLSFHNKQPEEDNQDIKDNNHQHQEEKQFFASDFMDGLTNNVVDVDNVNDDCEEEQEAVDPLPIEHECGSTREDNDEDHDSASSVDDDDDSIDDVICKTPAKSKRFALTLNLPESSSSSSLSSEEEEEEENQDLSQVEYVDEGLQVGGEDNLKVQGKMIDMTSSSSSTQGKHKEDMEHNHPEDKQFFTSDFIDGLMDDNVGDLNANVKEDDCEEQQELDPPIEHECGSTKDDDYASSSDDSINDMIRKTPAKANRFVLTLNSPESSSSEEEDEDDQDKEDNQQEEKQFFSSDFIDGLTNDAVDVDANADDDYEEQKDVVDSPIENKYSSTKDDDSASSSNDSIDDRIRKTPAKAKRFVLTLSSPELLSSSEEDEIDEEDNEVICIDSAPSLKADNEDEVISINTDYTPSPIYSKMNKNQLETSFQGTPSSRRMTVLLSPESGKKDIQEPESSWVFKKKTKEYCLKDSQSAKIILPKKVYKKLFDYQRVGVHWMATLHENNIQGGILGDDMGLGKTIQTASFLAGMMRSKNIKNALVICPPSLLDSWRRETEGTFRHCLNSYMIEVIDSKVKKPERPLISREALECSSDCPYLIISSHSLVSSSPIDFLGGNRDLCLNWDYVVVDEGHAIKNHNTKLHKSCVQIASHKDTHRLLLTGTPIQNNMKELWALFSFVSNNGLFGPLKRFQAQFGTPIENGRNKNATEWTIKTADACTERLQNIIKPHFLQRLKNDVLKNNLPPKHELVVWTQLTTQQRKRYEDYLKDSGDVAAVLSGETRSPLVAISWLKKLCGHSSLVTNDIELDNDFLDGSGKLQVLLSLLQSLKRDGHRTLVFSQSTKMLDIIEAILTDESIEFGRIDGKTEMRDRQQLVDRFNNHDYPEMDVMLISTKTGGVGLTLTGADRAVIYDPSWNPAEDSQAVDRCYRIGQKREVIVYRFITAGTIEEKMYEKQVFKDGIRRTVTAADATERHYSETELHQLFELMPEGICKTLDKATKMNQDDTIIQKEDISLHEKVVGISFHDVFYNNIVDVDAKESTPPTSFGGSRKIAKNMNDVRNEAQPLGRKLS